MTIPSWCRVGAKCVCVKRGPWQSHAAGEKHPAFGDKLTIRTVYENSKGECYLRFVEIVNPNNHRVNPDDGTRGECQYWSDQFRPLIDDSDEAQERDVALFTHWLTQPVSTTTRERVDG